MYNASSNATFLYYPMKADQASAEATCNTQGGHLAIYTSLAEQIEVEQVGSKAMCRAMQCVIKSRVGRGAALAS
jgi:hypothetical protein